MTLKWRRWGVFNAGLLLFYFTSSAYAVDKNFGDISKIILSVEVNLHFMLRALCIVTGVGLLFGGLIQIKKHIDNPAEVRLSTSIALFLIGLAMIGLAYIPMPKT